MPLLHPPTVARVLAPRTVSEEELGGGWAPVVRARLDDGTGIVS